MKKFALASKLFALTALFAVSTSSSIAYPQFDFTYGGGRLTRQAPVAQPHTHEYNALSTPAAARFNRPASNHYIPDISREGLYTWEAHKMPIKVFISNGEGVSGYRPQFNDYIRTSFDTWCEASGSKLSWVEVKDEKKADVTVFWTDKVFERPEGTEAGKTAALTRLNTATGKGIIYGARMQMLTRLPGRMFGDAEVAKTCLHETGHALGLQGHSRNRDDIMFYAVSPDQEFRLSQRDKTTISSLYANYPAASGLAVGPKPQDN